MSATAAPPPDAPDAPPEAPRPLWHAARPWLAALLVMGAVAWGRAFFEARAELARGVAAEAAGDSAEALLRYQYAARWYTPGAAAPAAALDALVRLSAEAESRGDRPTALAAARRARGAILSTRALWTPFADRRAEVDARLARLSAREQQAQGLDRGRPPEALERWHADLLAADPTPAPGWALAASLGFLGWVAGALGFLFRGLDARLRLVRPAAGRWAALFLICFGLWLAGTWLA